MGTSRECRQLPSEFFSCCVVVTISFFKADVSDTRSCQGFVSRTPHQQFAQLCVLQLGHVRFTLNLSHIDELPHSFVIHTVTHSLCHYRSYD